MPDRRKSRGPHPKDSDCFAPATLPVMRTAVAEISWLLTRGYPRKAALKLVGDRHALRDRQRKAVQRCAASDGSCDLRRAHEVEAPTLAGEVLVIDGYNVLLTLEAALSGGALLVGRDGAIRDMAAMSRHYRRVHVTRPALALVADFTGRRRCARLEWYLDRPISNSGRLRTLIVELAEARDWPWSVHLDADPDATLIASSHVAASSDSAILEGCGRWFNLTRAIVEESIPDAWIVDLGTA